MMNERIKQLAEQAGYLPDNFGISHWDMPECKKFAELIVRKCVAICQDVDGEDNIDARSGRQDCAVEIKQHFGIEERKGWVCPKCGVDRAREACPKGHTAAITGDCPMTATAQSGVEE